MMIRHVFDLSLRVKLPLWGSVLILVTTACLSIAMLSRTYEDLRQDILYNSEWVGRSVASALFPLMLHDEVWKAYEMLQHPFKVTPNTMALHPNSLIVLDQQRRVYVSSDPKRFPVLTELVEFGADYQRLDEQLATALEEQLITLQDEATMRVFIVVPIIEDRVKLGSLVVESDAVLIQPRFTYMINQAVWVTLMILFALIGVTLYWGWHLSEPLQLLAGRMEKLRDDLPEALDKKLYPYHDEVGRLFQSYGEMVEQLRQSKELKKQMVQSQRLAAVGHLTASIAHEINNPLGGLLTAVNTIKRYGALDSVTSKSVALVERGLLQIKETVAALLVEAKPQAREFCLQDIEDVKLLVQHEAEKKQILIDWKINLSGPLSPSSTQLRQILINLLLNAISAAEVKGLVVAAIEEQGQELCIDIENDGRMLTPKQLETLYEPFSSCSDGGHGLGLWITYQIVQQLKGRIETRSEAGRTRFRVVIPLMQDRQGDA